MDRSRREIARGSRPSFFDAAKIPGRRFRLFQEFVQGRLCLVPLVSFALAKSPRGHPQPYLRSADTFVYFVFINLFLLSSLSVSVGKRSSYVLLYTIYYLCHSYITMICVGPTEPFGTL